MINTPPNPETGKSPEVECEWAHNHLAEVIDSRIARCKMDVSNDIHEIREFVHKINAAFVKTHDGEHDYYGHHLDHAARIKAAKAEEEFWETAKREAMKGGVQWLFHGLKILLILALAGIAVKSGGWVKFP